MPSANHYTSEPSVSSTITFYPASTSPLREAAALGPFSTPHPPRTNTPPNPYRTGIILGSISIVVVAIATIVSLAFYFTNLWKKCGCRGCRLWRRRSRRIVIDLDATAGRIGNLEAGNPGVIEAYRSPRLFDGESSLGSPTSLAWSGRSARESLPSGAQWPGPSRVAAFEGVYPYPYPSVVPPPERSQTTRYAQPVGARPDPRHMRSNYEQQGAIEVPPTARPAQNQRQRLRSNRISLISSSSIPLKRSRVGGTSWGVDPRSTSPPSPRLTRQPYSPSATSTERDQTHISPGTSNSPDFAVGASGMAQPAKARPSRKAVKKPDYASSVFPTSPGQRRSRSPPTPLVTGASHPAQNTADFPITPTRTLASESSTTYPAELRAGEPSGSNQRPPNYDYVATSRMRGSA